MTNLQNWTYFWGGIGAVAIAFYWQQWDFLSVAIGGAAVVVLLKILASKPTDETTITRSSLKKFMAQVDKIIDKISDEPIRARLKTEIEQIATDLDQNQFRIAVFGIGRSGKTAIINALSRQNLNPQKVEIAPAQSLRSNQLNSPLNSPFSSQRRKISLIDTPGTQNRGILGQAQAAEARAAAESADLLLFVTASDLGAVEYQALLDLQALGKRIILVFNKIDQFLPPDRQAIINELERKTANFLLPADIVAIAADPSPITVRQYDDENSTLIKEWLEPVSADIDALKTRIEHILSHEWEELQLSNINQRLQQLQTFAQNTLQKIRRAQGQVIISRYQWLNAGVIFASPIPAVDLIASVAINARLLLELSQLYERQLSLKQAQKIAMTMVEILIKLGCVEVATVAIANQTAYFLKTNALTFAVGGTVQAMSAAYLTYIGGVSFLDYLDATPELDDFNLDNLMNNMRDICAANFVRMKEIGFIKEFVGQVISNFAPST